MLYYAIVASTTMAYNKTISNCSNKRGLDTLDDVGSDDQKVVATNSGGED